MKKLSLVKLEQRIAPATPVLAVLGPRSSRHEPKSRWTNENLSLVSWRKPSPRYVPFVPDRSAVVEKRTESE